MLRGVFEEYGYDTQRLFDAAQADPALGATLRLTEDPDFSAASERIDAFVARACAITRSSDRASLSPSGAVSSQPPRWTTSSRPRRARSAERPGWSASG